MLKQMTMRFSSKVMFLCGFPSAPRLMLTRVLDASGLLDLYEASGKDKYLMLAIALQERQDSLFWDDDDGGYFTSVKDEHILLRSKDAQVRLFLMRFKDSIELTSLAGWRRAVGRINYAW